MPSAGWEFAEKIIPSIVDVAKPLILLVAGYILRDWKSKKQRKLDKIKELKEWCAYQKSFVKIEQTQQYYEIQKYLNNDECIQIKNIVEQATEIIDEVWSETQNKYKAVTKGEEHWFKQNAKSTFEFSMQQQIMEKTSSLMGEFKSITITALDRKD